MLKNSIFINILNIIYNYSLAGYCGPGITASQITHQKPIALTPLMNYIYIVYSISFHFKYGVTSSIHNPPTRGNSKK